MRFELRRKLNQPVTVLGLSDVITYSFLGGTLPDGVTFSRSGAALYIDAAGELVSAAADVARFDYDPDTLALRGLLLEPSVTNKCLNYNANPTDLTGMTAGGDAAAVLSVVDDSAALAAAGLDTICSSGMVYRLDNSSGTGNAQARVSGSVGNTNVHSISAYIRGGSGNIQLAGGDGVKTFPTSSAYVKRISESITPSPSTDSLYIVASAGEVVYFILNQLEEYDSVTSPVIVSGASATREGDHLVFEDLEGVYNLAFYNEGGSDTLSGVSMSAGIKVAPRYGHTQRIEARVASGGITLESLFAGGSAGGAWRYDDAYSDTAMTTPAVDGGTVAALRDFSGNDNHITQPTASRRPELNVDVLDFDGVDDHLGVAISGLSLADGVTAVVSADWSGSSDYIATVSNYQSGVRGAISTTGRFSFQTGPAVTSDTTPSDGIYSLTMFRSVGTTGDVSARVEGGTWVTQTGIAQSEPLGLGGPGTNYSSLVGSTTASKQRGRLIIGRELTDAEIAFAESWVKGEV